MQKQQKRAISIIKALRIATKGMMQPASNLIVDEFGQDPYLVLIGCLLSLRTKDTVSWPASRRLFHVAKTPQEMLRVPIKKLEQLIYPCGFYKRKAVQLHYVSHVLIEEFNGKVPNTREQLLSIKGVGPKTASLVLAEAFNIPAICVDTHVHRISNRLGLVKTTTVEETEQALEKLLPKKYWAEYATLIVMWGQNICVPISPLCSKCAVFDLCKRVGVKRAR